ncbi:ADP-ribosylglycohydrolase family protein [Thermodesulfobacteriota bacterium]
MQDAIVGCILGTAVGDALGLPFEGLSPRRAERIFGQYDRYRFFLNKGMVSDDTEHTCMVAQALIESAGEVSLFAELLAGRLRLWLLTLPAGVGFATLRAILKLWCGIHPERSGVFSAGNGPAMRSPIIGVYCGEDHEKIKALVKAGTVITHTDPKAYYGALAVALAASMNITTEPVDGASYYALLKTLLSDASAAEFLELIEASVKSSRQGASPKEFAMELNLQNGVSGYVYHTVPVVIQAWLRNSDDFESAILEVIACGGDTDTTAAILGGIVGSKTGTAGIPQPWLENLWEWPRSVSWLEALGQQLAQRKQVKAMGLPIMGVIARNIFFTLVVLLHGFRRLLPPY